MAAGQAVFQPKRARTPWLAGLGVALGLHLLLILCVHQLAPEGAVARQVQRLIPVFVAPRPAPEPRPTPTPPAEAPRENGGRSGSGLDAPAVPLRQPEKLSKPDIMIPAPLARQPDPEAPIIIGRAGSGENAGDGAAIHPGAGAGQGTGQGSGAGQGNGGEGGTGAGSDWKPQWRRLPSERELGRHYPAAAREAGVNGAAILRCTVHTTGRVSGCTVAAEAPKGLGFGQAAVDLSQYFRIVPRRVRGKAVDSELLIPLNMSLYKGPPAAQGSGGHPIGSSAPLSAPAPRVGGK